MYKVLNEDWEKITVSIIDATKHKHVSGREFGKEDGFNSIVKTIAKAISSKKVEPKKVKPLKSKKK